MVNRCEFWLPKKNRQCANSPLLNSLFCGNHTQRSHSQWIPCPIDPSHSVLLENLKSHLNRCPLLKRVRSLELQPFYQKGINACDEHDNDEAEKAAVDDSTLTSQMKRNAVYAMTGLEFSALVAKIKSVHSSLCSNIPGSYKIPGACSIWTHQEIDKKLPYQEKHVLQQASILGNLEEVGALKQSHLSYNSTNDQCDSSKESENHNDIPAVVEFGAGRGYLTQVLSDCYGIKKVVLVERKSYKLKADRSLRQKESLILERLRIDIEDLNLKAVEALQGTEYLAIGKHLCGPATDATLRCCISPQSEDSPTTQSQASYLKAIAIATCCHHLCLWKTYINKRYFSDLGFTKEDFHAISWFTSWAVDADHGSEFSVADHSAQLEIMWEKKETCPDLDLCAVEQIVRQMQPTDRAALGFMCKDIIDFGRLKWLESRGLKSHLAMINKFLRYYEDVESRPIFESVETMLKWAGLYDLTTRTLGKELVEVGLSPSLVQELVTVITRINYGQSVNISGLAGAVSLAGSGGGLWSVKGGNWQMAAGLIDHSDVQLLLNEEIESISYLGDFYELNSTVGKSYSCQVTVVATPLDELNIRFSPGISIPPRKLQHTHATFVRGVLNPAYFGLREVKDIPELVGTIESADIPFSCISILKQHEKDITYKVFSRQELADDLLDKIFSVREETMKVNWGAYPHYHAPEKYAPFILDDNHLYYVNAFENAASTIETSAVAAENIARLILSRLYVQADSSSPNLKSSSIDLSEKRVDL